MELVAFFWYSQTLNSKTQTKHTWVPKLESTFIAANNHFGLYGVALWLKQFKKEYGPFGEIMARNMQVSKRNVVDWLLGRALLCYMPLAAIAIVWHLAIGCQSVVAQSDEAIEPKASLGATEIVVEGAILKTIESVSVSSQVAGRISELTVKEGAKVKLDQEIGRVHDAAVKIQMEKARISIEIAERKQKNDIDKRLAAKNQQVAANEYRRAVEANLQVQDVYPLNEIDRLKLIFSRTELELERAVHQQSMADLDKSLAETEYKASQELAQRHRIQAPCDGVVIALEKRMGEWVEPGTIVLKIVQIDKLRIEGFIQAADATLDLVGSTAEVLFDTSNPQTATTAKLVFVSPRCQPIEFPSASVS